jgi:UDP-2-acetamido-3-amino-2,3-dideoxy-glucuronate N-acetyltransferase
MPHTFDIHPSFDSVILSSGNEGISLKKHKINEVSYKPGPLQKIRAVKCGPDVLIGNFVNLYECEIGAGTEIGDFVEIGRGVRIGERCKIGNFAYICPGVLIEDDVLIGEAVNFINDRYPKATNSSGTLQTENDWQCRPTLVKSGVYIGARTAIMCDITIGKGAQVGAGAVVTKDVPDEGIVTGNPAANPAMIRAI